MKLIKLEVTNFRKIEAVELNIDRDLVELTGKNKSGKSSTLDAPWVLLKGIASKDPIRPTPTQPIREGEEQATIRGTFKGVPVDLIVTRTFKKSDSDPRGWTTKVEVETPEGMTFKVSPQKQLDAIIGEHRLDPLEFIALAPKEQMEAFRVFVPGVDFEAIDQANDKDAEERKELNRKAKDKQTEAALLYWDDGTPDDEVDIAALSERIEARNAQAAEVSRFAQWKEGIATKIDGQTAKIQNFAADQAEARRVYEKTFADLEEKIAAAQAERTRLNGLIEAAKEPAAPEDGEPLMAQLRSASATNEQVRKKIKRAALTKEIATLEGKATALTEAIKKRCDERDGQIKSAPLPLPNIGFGKEGLYLNGRPFAEASTAEQIETAVALSAALNPELKLVWIRDGSLLDDDALKRVAELAKAKDLNILIETVRPLTEAAIVLEEGKIKKAKAVKS